METASDASRWRRCADQPPPARQSTFRSVVHFMKNKITRIAVLLLLLTAALFVSDWMSGNKLTRPTSVIEKVGGLFTAYAAAPSTEMQQTTNRLANEKSPYLLQHKNNPVDWYPWGEEAFAAAREQNKPIFLSVGYSTCHWCHVMNRESFSDPEVAAFMNAHFINIKLDREERPDVDRVYMTFVQATTGSGGWPMSVWLTPELEPLVGGTYFPPKDAYGRPGFLTVLERVATAWEEDEKEMRSQAGQVTDQLRQFSAPSPQQGGSVELTAAPLSAALKRMEERFDPKEGGFGPAPKFPRPSELLFLFNEAHRLGPDSEEGKRAIEMAVFTLEKMMHGGIQDHLGGGFHRYSVDARWHIPHYEKMLYDQAQLVEAYLIAYQLTGRNDFADTVRDILAYVSRDMISPGGGFYSAEDADSLAEGADHKTEGAFYIWKRAEIDQLLGDDAKLFNAVYGVKPDGNAAPESDPHGELKGTNTLYRQLSDAEAAKEFKLDPAEVAEKLAAARQTLFDARAKRHRPHLDDKVITAWNGLMITAFAKAYQVLGEEAYLTAANRAADFLRSNLYDEKNGTLLRTWRESPSDIGGFAEDYTYLIRGLLDLYESSFDTDRIAWAIDLQKKQDELFWDKEHGGYFSSTGKDPSVLLRMKEDYDGAEPSPNTIAAINLMRLSHLLGDPAFARRAEETLQTLAPQFESAPLAVPMGLVALETALNPGQQIVLVGSPTDPALQEMLRIIRSRFLPGAVTVLLDDPASRAFFTKHAEFYGSATELDGKPTAYVCENFVCQLPTTEPKTLAKQLNQ